MACKLSLELFLYVLDQPRTRCTKYKVIFQGPLDFHYYWRAPTSITTNLNFSVESALSKHR